jgi:hypothetical protein
MNDADAGPSRRDEQRTTPIDDAGLFHRVFEAGNQAQVTDDTALHLHADNGRVTRIDEFGEVHRPHTNFPL